MYYLKSNFVYFKAKIVCMCEYEWMCPSPDWLAAWLEERPSRLSSSSAPEDDTRNKWI